MKLSTLTAISPIDGRYREKLEDLSLYFSEFALIKYRVKVEVLYLIELAKIRVIGKLSKKEKDFLVSIFEKFKLSDGQKVKNIEKKINHDVKAVEYFIKGKLEKTSLTDIKEFVHFALTSEDITNLSYSLAIQDCLKEVYFPTLNSLIREISSLANKYKNVAMLARTHGQPASPTTMGKELAVFVYRLRNQIKSFPKLTGKLNGAVGNYNAHLAAFPKISWVSFSQKFIKSLGLVPNLLTTQIENHDCWAQVFHAAIRVNNILLGFDRDIWMYISFDYLKQKVIKKEVGSSTMPHKVNPIDFENSEGNAGLANSILNHLANKLPISRLQRDLTDSTVSRNIGVAFSHCLLAFKSTMKGLAKIQVNQEILSKDLKDHPEVIAEAIQVTLRREKLEMPYEVLKKLTRGRKITLADFHQFIDSLKVSDKVKRQLKKIRPDNYVGLAEELVEIAIKDLSCHF